MPEVELEKARCLYRDTPWDQHAFGIKTREIQKIEYTNDLSLNKLFDTFESRNVQDDIALCYTRIDADDRSLRAMFEKAGYKNVENSYVLSLKNFSSFYPLNRFGRSVELRKAESDDLEALQKIAAEDFYYGRFAEDPAISHQASKQRQRNWIMDMFNNPQFTIWVHGKLGEPRGFHAFQRHDTHVDLVLTGMGQKYQTLAGFFWASCLQETAKLGITTASTMISAANVPVVNLYAGLGFRFDRLLSGMHKHWII